MGLQGKILVGTTKGLLHLDLHKGHWEVTKVDFPGLPVSMIYYDYGSGKCWVGLSMKHWGPKLFYARKGLDNWEELPAPLYPEGVITSKGKPAALRLIWSAFYDRNQERLWIGTEPGGLFTDNAADDTFLLNAALWNHPTRREHWFGGGRDDAGIHTILGHPTDPDFLLVGVSCGGVYTTHDAGKNWTENNRGLRADYLPNPTGPHGHDPHAIKICRDHPSTIWQQNHCGVFVSHDLADTWQDVTPADEFGRYGFALAIDDTDPLRAWIIPAESDENRVAKDLRLVVSMTEDGGKSWTKQTEGLPQQDCFDLVFRHALDRQQGLMCFGTTTGNLFLSENDGISWIQAGSFLPPIHSVLCI